MRVICLLAAYVRSKVLVRYYKFRARRSRVRLERLLAGIGENTTNRKLENEN